MYYSASGYVLHMENSSKKSLSKFSPLDNDFFKRIESQVAEDLGLPVEDFDILRKEHSEKYHALLRKIMSENEMDGKICLIIDKPDSSE